MNLPVHIAKHMRDVHFGGNWTVSNFKDVLSDVTWEQATTKVDSFNTIATLVYHTHYFVHAVLNVLRGNPLDAHDKFSFDHPPIQSQKDWDSFLKKVWQEAEELSQHIEQLPEEQLWDDFSDKKYGNYYRNLNGIIEHAHYHLGQIVLIKKLLHK